MPQGEDVSLTDAEQRALLAFAMKHVAGRVPVIAHISDSGTAIAVARAKHAATLGAAAIASHPPYFWHPKPAMVVEHLVQVGRATNLPFFVCTPVVESAGTHLTAEIVLDVLKQLDNVAGWSIPACASCSCWKRCRSDAKSAPAFELLAGTDMMVPNGTLGGSGVFSPLASIAPRLVRELYDLCRKQQFVQARKIQEQLAELHHLVKMAGRSGLKGAMRASGATAGSRACRRSGSARWNSRVSWNA